MPIAIGADGAPGLPRRPRNCVVGASARFGSQGADGVGVAWAAVSFVVVRDSTPLTAALIDA